MPARLLPIQQSAALLPRPLGAAALTAAVIFASGCATGPQASKDDPLEPMNRVVFKVNDTVDQYVAVPIAKGYQKVTPEPARTAVTNFFSNLADVGNFANNVLQGKGVAAAETLMRVAINSVFGIGGLIDIATPAGLPKHSQDFGLTLGVWGVPSGPYIVLPLFGPSSVRDGVGLGASFYLDPAHYLDPAWRNSLFGVNVVSTRANLLGATDLLSQAALDKYAFVRDAYTQRRQYLIDSGSGKLPAYEDEDDDAKSDADASPAAGAFGATPAPAPAPVKSTSPPVDAPEPPKQ
ncbi:MlaA family lipoprotein [Cupriavidus pampae]|uniref:VacJ family lipoprotein n=1 Tax=Cupriavidus pampae TaxID=659251 RepID=A0ABN7YDI1_9BURK|nr:VacJ family lipoprotein [Cupriavidus pampae]CAG9171467.1 hypothetical protein LMG32289_02377 [Cupriavidus pampae]